MDVHVSWRAVLHRINESRTAEDRSILIAAGENKSWVVAGELGAWVVYQSSGEFPESSTGEYQTSRLNAGETRLRIFSQERSTSGNFTGELKIFLPKNSVGRRLKSLILLGIVHLKLLICWRY